jgi:signal transduction histidine kinase/AmiR/NasT family two-component response regulator
MKWEDTQMPRILIVDDNPRIHEDFELVFLDRPGALESGGDKYEIYEHTERPAVSKPAYELDHALSGSEGVEKIQGSVANGRPYQVAFVDIRMPGMDGVETIEQIWSIDARIQTVICTAYADYRWEDLARRLGQSDRLLVLKKPFDHIEAVQLASTLTEKWFLARQAALKFEQMELLVAQRTQRFLDLQRRDTERAQELDQIKLRFLSNLSQEFRTPLTLILNGLEQMQIPESDRPHETLVRRSTERLLHLVEESLNLSHLDEKSFRLQPSEADLVVFLQGVVALFKPVASRQKVQLDLQINKASWPARFEVGKLEKILFNLLSHSLKSTPEGGRITVQARLRPEGMELVIEDSGVGTPQAELPSASDPLFTTGSAASSHLTDLDLVLSQELVRLQGGSLVVASPVSRAGAPSKFHGTRCTISLPLPDVSPANSSAAGSGTPGIHASPATSQSLEEGASMKEQPLILLVQDNAELAQYLQQGFGPEYRIMDAKDGIQGLSQARETVPDVIIAEITLSGLDGVELCRKLKSDELTSHIPIILLTAHDSESGQLRALEAGADDYIVKPFKLPLLRARVDNLMQSRQKLHELFGQAGQVSPRDLATNQSDARFFRRAMDLVEEHMADLEFDVETMARKLAVSRRQLFRKIRAAAGCSPNVFVRTLRLKRAARLLNESQLTVTEITYAVGFSDLKYFRSIFREHYGVLPGEYPKRSKAP